MGIGLRLSRRSKISVLFVAAVVMSVGIALALLREGTAQRVARIIVECGRLHELDARASEAGDMRYVSPGLARSNLDFLYDHLPEFSTAVIEMSESGVEEDMALAIRMLDGVGSDLKLRDERGLRVLLRYLYEGQGARLLMNMWCRIALTVDGDDKVMVPAILRALLHDGGRQWRVLGRAMQRARFGLPEGVDSILQYLCSDDASLRHGAALALGLCFAEERPELVYEQLGSTSAEMRGCVSIGLTLGGGDILRNVVVLSENKNATLRAWAKAKLEGHIPGTAWPPVKTMGRSKSPANGDSKGSR